MDEKSKKKINPIYLFLGISAGIFVILFFLAQLICVYPKYTVEAGTPCPADRFARIRLGNVEFDPDSEFFEVSVPGTYSLRIKNGLFTHDCRLTIVDDIAPQIGLCDVVTGTGKEIEASSFVDMIGDATECEVTYVSGGPDYSLIDQTQQVAVRVTDMGGNSVEASANLTILPMAARVTVPILSELPDASEFLDPVAAGEDIAYAGDVTTVDTATAGIYPVDIAFRGAVYTAEIEVRDMAPPVFSDTEEKYLKLGDSISYKSLVTVSDDSGSCELTFDASAVDATKPGSYPVIYTAVDASGNTSTATVTVSITEYSASEQELYDAVDDILAGIITEDMDVREKARAIFEYVTEHVNYTADSERTDTVTEALQGIQQGMGDCHVYASLSEVMLTRAGIKNERTEAQTDGGVHDWNLVDIGDGHGWYHFDTTPRVGHPRLFLSEEYE